MKRDELTCDAIAGTWRIWQRRRGHRYSLDDVLTAWEAVQAAPCARHVLDLGCGVGSVLLMTAYKLREARLQGIEAQRQSFDLAEKNVQMNGLVQRAVVRHADLRQVVSEEDSSRHSYDLVTGTPPYQPVGTATLSPDSQRAHARWELRGGIEAYLEAASKVLSSDGRAVVCMHGKADARVRDAARQAKLYPLQRRPVFARRGHDTPLFCVWVFSRELGGLTEATAWYARCADGSRTSEARAVRSFFGLSINPDEPPSP